MGLGLCDDAKISRSSFALIWNSFFFIEFRKKTNNNKKKTFRIGVRNIIIWLQRNPEPNKLCASLNDIEEKKIKGWNFLEIFLSVWRDVRIRKYDVLTSFY